MYSLDPEGTVKDKEMKAEMAAAEWRRRKRNMRQRREVAQCVQFSARADPDHEKKYEHMVNVAKGGI
ncbi:hypothetical protein C1N77_18950 [Geobacillus thermoleovorans]